MSGMFQNPSDDPAEYAAMMIAAGWAIEEELALQDGRAVLIGHRPDGGFKWCAYPCQKLGADGQKLRRVCRVAVDPRHNGNVWTVTGPREAPTLSPSVDCQDKPCWHGFIVDGEVRP